MRVLIIPIIQCIKCFATYTAIILDESQEIEYVHYIEVDDHYNCPDKFEKFKVRLSEFTKVL